MPDLAPRTATIPFDPVMLDDLDRFGLVVDVADRVPGLGSQAGHLRRHVGDERLRLRARTRAHGDDAPQVRDRTFPGR